jgi:hypothetical protein
VRESTRNLVLGSSAGVVLVLAGVFYLRSTGNARSLPDEYNIDGVCLNCHESGEFTYATEQRQPLVCPKCGERAVYSWFYCPKCRKRFVPNLERRDGGPPRLPIVPTCTECGAMAGTYMKEDPVQDPVGDAPLPEWPPE